MGSNGLEYKFIDLQDKNKDQDEEDLMLVGVMKEDVIYIEFDYERIELGLKDGNEVIIILPHDNYLLDESL